jgi:hypothetical protein
MKMDQKNLREVVGEVHMELYRKVESDFIEKITSVETWTLRYTSE